jgi:hypothetical protein
MARARRPTGLVVELVAPGQGGDGLDLDWSCQHYRCRRRDVTPVLYEVLGASFVRLLCPRHDPALVENAA